MCVPRNSNTSCRLGKFKIYYKIRIKRAFPLKNHLCCFDRKERIFVGQFQRKHSAFPLQSSNPSNYGLQIAISTIDFVDNVRPHSLTDHVDRTGGTAEPYTYMMYTRTNMKKKSCCVFQFALTTNSNATAPNVYPSGRDVIKKTIVWTGRTNRIVRERQVSLL